MKRQRLQVPNLTELAWTQVAEAALGVVAGDISDELSLDQEEEIVRYIRGVIIPWLEQQALSERSTTEQRIHTLQQQISNAGDRRDWDTCDKLDRELEELLPGGKDEEK